ncbi:hypothetical protein D3C72_2308910 [compost metagenome]
MGDDGLNRRGRACGFGVERRDDQHRLFAPFQEKSQKPFMRIAGESGQIVDMLRIGYEQSVHSLCGDFPFQTFQRFIH